MKKHIVLKTFRMNSFSIRARDKWNNLADDTVNSSTVLSFKTMYDRYMGIRNTILDIVTRDIIYN